MQRIDGVIATEDTENHRNDSVYLCVFSDGVLWTVAINFLHKYK